MGTGLLGVAGALGLGPWQLGASAASARIVDTRTLGPSGTRLRLDWRTLAVGLSAAADALCTVRRVARMPGMPRDSKKFKNKACIAAEFS